jgi:hypothetical protein
MEPLDGIEPHGRQRERRQQRASDGDLPFGPRPMGIGHVYLPARSRSEIVIPRNSGPRTSRRLGKHDPDTHRTSDFHQRPGDIERVHVNV